MLILRYSDYYSQFIVTDDVYTWMKCVLRELNDRAQELAPTSKTLRLFLHHRILDPPIPPRLHFLLPELRDSADCELYSIFHQDSLAHFLCRLLYIWSRARFYGSGELRHLPGIYRSDQPLRRGEGSKLKHIIE